MRIGMLENGRMKKITGITKKKNNEKKKLPTFNEIYCKMHVGWKMKQKYYCFSGRGVQFISDKCMIFPLFLAHWISKPKQLLGHYCFLYWHHIMKYSYNNLPHRKTISCKITWETPFSSKKKHLQFIHCNILFAVSSWGQFSFVRSYVCFVLSMPKLPLLM